MLERLSIERFKSIRSAIVDFGRVNLFIGANGSGKSNVLEAIGLTAAALGRGLGSADLARRGIRLTPSELMKSAHKYFELPKTLELDAEFSNGLRYRCNLTSGLNDSSLRFHSEACTYKGKPQFGRSPRGNKVHGISISGTLEKSRGMWDQIQVAYPFNETIRETIGDFGRYSIYSPQTDFLRGRKSGLVDEPPVGLHGEGLPEAALGLIRQALASRHLADPGKSIADFSRRAVELFQLPGWTKRVRVGALDRNLVSPDVDRSTENMVYFIDRYMRDDRNKLSAYDSSEGTLFLLFAAILLAHRDSPKYFALDNVDSALNPKVTRLLVERIVELTLRSSAADLDVGPRQIFLTSHNPTSLDAIDLFDNNQRAFVVSRDEAGFTQIKRIKPKEGLTRTEWSLQTGGRNLSQMWLEGAIANINGRDDF